MEPEEIFARSAEVTCAHYCGDENCDCCNLYGYLVGPVCQGCDQYISITDYCKEITKEWESEVPSTSHR